MGRDLFHDLEMIKRAKHHRAPASPRPPGKIRIALQSIKLIHEIRMKKASWKTTLGGLIAGAAPLVKNMLPPEWHWVGDAMLSIGSLIVGLSARDNTVTSEQARAK